jgi:helix-turn-helix protein
MERALMSIKLISKAWDLDLPTAEKFVLVALADNASDEGVCWPSVRRIARKVAMSPRAVIRIIDRLEAKSLVVTKQKGGGRIPNQYGLHLEAGKILPPFVPAHAGGDHDDPSQAQAGRELAPAVSVGDQCSAVTADMNVSQSSCERKSPEPSNNHQKKRQTEPATAKGVITEVRKTPTKTGISRVLFKIGDVNGKAFGLAADRLLTWGGECAELTGNYETSDYGTEFVAQHGRILVSAGSNASAPTESEVQESPAQQPTTHPASLPANFSAPSRPVTFEDLERQYLARFEKTA